MRGQAELILLMPLLLAVLMLNFIVIQNLEQNNLELSNLMREYDALIFGYAYTKDPATGNVYPVVP